VEGKSDYYVLRYGARLLGRAELPILPGLGAGTFGALAALHVGWNLKFLFLLDSDRQGTAERDRYITDFGIPAERVGNIGDFVEGVSAIEDLLDERALAAISIALSLGKVPSKGQIRRFFQERLASDNIETLSDGFKGRVEALLDGLEARLG